MKEILTHTLSIIVAALLLLILVAPARAYSAPTNTLADTLEDDIPLPEPTPQTGITQEVVNEVPPTLAAAPVITVWYENSLNFGQIGNPQPQVNILGNVRDPDSNGSISSLNYRLNGGSPVSVPIGPNGNRLENRGDFNIALNTSSLNNGANTLVITAVDNTNAEASKTVNFNYTAGRIWPAPYSINWASATSINQVAQVVDGLWSLSPAGVRTTQTGYDRLIALGGMNWAEYEVLATITVHNWPVKDSSGMPAEGGVGIITRWNGHGTGSVLPDNWWDMGSYGYYSARTGNYAMWLNQTTRVTTSSASLQLNIPYLFKVRVVNGPGGGQYSLKAWIKGQPEPAWGASPFGNVTNVVDSNGDRTSGSVLLVAHQADATFGDVHVCPSSISYPLTVNVSGGGSVTRNANKASYSCGEGVSLTANASQGWEFAGWSGDFNGPGSQLNINVVKPTTITAVFQQTGSVVLDNKLYIPSIQK